MTFAARFRRSLTIWAGLGCAAVYWAVAPFLPTNVQTEWLRVFMIVLGLAIVVTCLKAFRDITRTTEPLSAQQYILGTFLREVGLLGSAMWLLIWRGAEFPSWMIVSDINAWFLYLIVLGQMFVVIAPRDKDRDPPRVRWAWLFVLIAIAVGLGYYLVVIRPDFRALAALLQGWFPNG